jgi:hypothetical protein
MGTNSRAEEERAINKQKLDEASDTGVFTSAASVRQFLTRNGFELRSAEEILKDHGGRPLAFDTTVPFVINREASVTEFVNHWIFTRENPRSCRKPLAATSGAPGTGKTRFMALLQELDGKAVTKSPKHQRAWDGQGGGHFQL